MVDLTVVPLNEDSNEEIIASLEMLLDEAKIGALTEFAYAAVRRDGSCPYGYCKGNDIILVAGAVAHLLTAISQPPQ